MRSDKRTDIGDVFRSAIGDNLDFKTLVEMYPPAVNSGPTTGWVPFPANNAYVHKGYGICVISTIEVIMDKQVVRHVAAVTGETKNDKNPLGRCSDFLMTFVRYSFDMEDAKEDNTFSESSVIRHLWLVVTDAFADILKSQN